MTSKQQITEKKASLVVILVWLALVALTLTSFCLGETGMQGKTLMLMLLAITMVKSQLVANYFMGLNKTRLIWRSVMFFYFVIVGGLIAIAYLKGLQ